jgi:hypothetical protein
MQLDVVGRQIERADKKGDNAKVEELEMKEEKLSTIMATIMDPTPEKEVRPRRWNTLVEDTMENGKLPSAKKLKFKASSAPTTPAPTTLVGTTTPAPTLHWWERLLSVPGRQLIWISPMKTTRAVRRI